ncbi:hypothetical protein Tco_1434059, partial [Tanacetum coccineum]
HKQALGYQNPFYLKKVQRIKPTLYDGSVISNQHAVIPVIDDEETLILEDITPDAITEGEWGFEHTKAIFLNEVIPFLKSLKDIFNVFDKDLLNEVTKVQTGFNQMEVDVQQCSDVLLTVMDSTIAYGDFVNLEMQSESCDKCFDLDAELLKKQNAYNELLKSYSQLEKYSQLQAKDTTICKLKEHIKSMRENNKEEKVKQDMDEIETINIELEYSVAKLLSKNECLHKEIDHLKQIYKDQFDSIKKTRVYNKEHLKGKEIVENATQIPNATTIVLRMFILDLDPLAPRLLKNRDAHIDYLKHTQDQADILRGIVEQAKAKQPLDNALDFTCKHAKRIQKLLVYVRDTCPNAIKLSDKLVGVTLMNKVKKVRFFEPLTSSSYIHIQVELSKTPDSNTHVLPSTGLKSSTSASRSQPTSNKKNDKISQTSSSNMKNKVIQIVLWYTGLQMFKTYDREPLSAHELRQQISRNS